MQFYRIENGQTSSRIYRKLGRPNELLARFSNDREQIIAWTKSEASKDTEEYNRKNDTAYITFSQAAYIPKNEERSFNAGCLFLQQLFT